MYPKWNGIERNSDCTFSTRHTSLKNVSAAKIISRHPAQLIKTLYKNHEKHYFIFLRSGGQCYLVN